MADSIARMFSAAVSADPSRPLLTWYDDAVGERTELSGATLGNWVAKTANLLVDGAGLAPGDPVGVLLPPHWQTAAVLLGAWSAGLVVHQSPDDGPVEALFAAADRIEEATRWSAGEQYALSLAPMAAPLREVPPGFVDYVVEVRAHGDHFSPSGAGPQDAELLRRAAARAAELGLTHGARVLVDAARYPDPVDWLLAPLTVGGSIVLCGHVDAERLASRTTTERVTVTLR
ncbi:MAG TPA: TIGR03089 family protein [Micromonospora sp.]